MFRDSANFDDTEHLFLEDVNATEEVDSRTALMDSIREGRELKKVEAPSVPQTTLSGRDKLMNDITSGVLLKHVSVTFDMVRCDELNCDWKLVKAKIT